MFFRSRRSNAGNQRDRPRYVSSLQRDVRKYEGWTREQVEKDYLANRSVHTIMTIGYMEYVDDVLVLTDKGRLLMQNVGETAESAPE
ncbi:MAG: hypothetical protein Q4Q58_00430 [Thermoplasmata archaeon]|nr:hypothetical protein [Thermoplasmata archaeon]